MRLIEKSLISPPIESDKKIEATMVKPQPLSVPAPLII